MHPITGPSSQMRALIPSATGSVTQKVIALVRCHPWAALVLTVGALTITASLGLAAYYGVRQLTKPQHKPEDSEEASEENALATNVADSNGVLPSNEHDNEVSEGNLFEINDRSPLPNEHVNDAIEENPLFIHDADEDRSPLPNEDDNEALEENALVIHDADSNGVLPSNEHVNDAIEENPLVIHDADEDKSPLPNEHNNIPSREEIEHEWTQYATTVRTYLGLEKSDISALVNFGLRPLNVAVACGNTEAVKAILKEGANVNGRDGKGWTPLTLAATSGNRDVVKILLDYKVDVNFGITDGLTPLHLAAENGYADMVTTLLANGAKVDEQSPEKYTPLHVAAYLGKVAVVKVLLDYRAGPSIVNDEGQTALDLAQQQKELAADDKKSQFDEVIELLQEASTVASE
ncbi:MAG: ankyrin repeat domain-containing protein [Chlamydiales bacterium]|nr:ankyrin repeat domain-containing protein [Chlamydiales bacterium]